MANEPGKVRRLLSLCERAKRDLTALTKAEIDLEPLLPDSDKVLGLTRAKFENLCQDLLQKTLACVRAALVSAEVSKPGTHSAPEPGEGGQNSGLVPSSPGSK